MSRMTRQKSLWAVGLTLLATGATSSTAAGPHDAPPPIPDPATRARLVEAERDAHAAAWATGMAREVHDEYDVDHYDITLSLDITNRIVFGTVSVEATSQMTDLSQVDLDLIDGMTVDATTAGGSPAFHVHANDTVTITLDGTYQPGESFTVSCTYHGTPVFAGGPFRWNNQNGVPMVLTYSEPFGAPAWWAGKDDPKDKATFDIHVTVPDSLFVVSNGLLASNMDNGDGTRTVNWVTSYLMSPYLFSLAITNFATWTEVYTALDGVTTMDVDYYAYPDDLAEAQISWGRNIEMMEYFAGIFGEYPFLDEKYAIAEFAHPGAMEHQTATSMGAGWVVPNTSNDWVVAHELAHSWVGNMITMTTWAHAWCKEGFATYCEALYFEDKFDTDYYHDYMADMDIFNYANRQIYDSNPPLHSAIYFKGAWVLHMLRHVVGDADFFDAIFAYTNDAAFRFGTADTDDLRMVFEAESGMDLVWFFDEWVYDAGYPTYHVDWSSVPVASGYDIQLDITQTQISGPIFKMPIDIRIDTDLGAETFVVWDSLITQSFTLHVDGEPASLELDPDFWIIREIETVGVGNGDPVVELQPPSARPNPFRSATAIHFHLDRSAEVELDVFDTAGRRVARLLDGVQAAGPGRVVWSGMDGDGRPVAPGVYYYRFGGAERGIVGRVVRLP